jgi:hypothetical protein
VFVTGVPGAGKTLIGLNVATRRQTFGEARAVYLSGRISQSVQRFRLATSMHPLGRNSPGPVITAMRDSVCPMLAP